MKLLDADEIEKRQAKLPVEWAVVSGNKLALSLKFDDFAHALEFMKSVSAIAEDLQHHPDINFGWGYANVEITTHSLGGLTNKDFDLAEAIVEKG